MTVSIFYSYSHKDEHYKNALETHLSVLKRQGYISSWNDRKIDPGSNWEEEINLNLQNSRVILLLVSANFLASDYCYDTETIFALEQHKKKLSEVIPIILKPCLWSSSHFSHLQALPKDGKPISKWKNCDEAWLSVAEGLIRTVTKLKIVDHKQSENKIDDGESPFSNDHLSYTLDEIFAETELNAIVSEARPLKELILLFLTRFNKFYFSPLRIQKWGSKQIGFGDLNKHTTEAIREELEMLYKSHKVKITTSQKGNRIFKIRL